MKQAFSATDLNFDDRARLCHAGESYHFERREGVYSPVQYLAKLFLKLAQIVNGLDRIYFFCLSSTGILLCYYIFMNM